MFKVRELKLERFFENKDLVSLDEIIDKLYEMDDEICYLQERYDDMTGARDRYYGEADKHFREDPELADKMHELNLLGLQ